MVDFDNIIIGSLIVGVFLIISTVMGFFIWSRSNKEQQDKLRIARAHEAIRCLYENTSSGGGYNDSYTSPPNTSLINSIHKVSVWCNDNRDFSNVSRNMDESELQTIDNLLNYFDMISYLSLQQTIDEDTIVTLVGRHMWESYVMFSGNEPISGYAEKLKPPPPPNGGRRASWNSAANDDGSLSRASSFYTLGKENNDDIGYIAYRRRRLQCPGLYKSYLQFMKKHSKKCREG